MRIAVIAHLKYPIAQPFAGGLEMHTNLLANALEDRGHSVTLFAANGSVAGRNVEPICEQTAIDRVGTAEANDIAFFREHHAYLKLMTDLRTREFDIVHNNSLHYLPVSMADSLPMPIVTVLHTPPFCWLESGVRLCKGSNAKFIAISDCVARMWSDVVTVDHTIHNGVDLNIFPFREVPEPNPYLIWYGRIVPEKGVHLAIDAAARTPYPLKIAGPIADRAYFEQEVRPRLNDKAIYCGHFAHDKLAALIGGALCALCTPRWDEPYGLVVAEALACGVPVASFDRGAVGEILTAECGVLATPDDPAALATAVERAIKLNRHACRHRAESFCEVDDMIGAYERLYRSLLLDADNDRPAVRKTGSIDSGVSLACA